MSPLRQSSVSAGCRPLLPWASPLEGCIRAMATVLLPLPLRARHTAVGCRGTRSGICSSCRCPLRAEARRTGEPVRAASPCCSGLPPSEDSCAARPCWDPVTRPVLPPEGVPNPKKLREAPHPVTFPSSWSRGDSVSSLLRRDLPIRSEDRRGRPSVRSTSSAEAVEVVSACRPSPRRRAARPSVPSPASWRRSRRTRRQEGELRSHVHGVSIARRRARSSRGAGAGSSGLALRHSRPSTLSDRSRFRDAAAVDSTEAVSDASARDRA